MKRVLVIGHFGGDENLADGQTIKTKILYEELEKTLKYQMIKVDTFYKKKHPIRLLLNSIFQMFIASDIIILLSRNGMKFYFPLCYYFAIIMRKRIYHDVIAGNLAELINKNPKFIKYLKSFEVNWVETKTLKQKLFGLGLKNAEVLPNFKNLRIMKKIEIKKRDDEPLKVCTFSRVMKEKGIQEAIDAVVRCNHKYGKTIYTLDIYGQIDQDQKEWFAELQNSFTEEISYKGIVEYSKTYEVLKDYYLLLFPTRYFTEGVPGTIIDAYAAGVPVIASKWEHYNDVVIEGKTGIGYSFDEEQGLQNVLEKAYSRKDLIENMRINCINTAKRYLPEPSIRIIEEKIDK